MLISTGFREIIGNAYNSIYHFPGIPILYNSKKKQFECHKKATKAAGFIFLGAMGILLALEYLFSTVHKSPNFKVMELFWVFSFFALSHMNWNLYSESWDIVALHNSFINMETRMVQAGYRCPLDHLTKVTKLACSFLMRPIPFLALCWGIGSAFLPCQPINFLFIFMPNSYCSVSMSQTIWLTTILKWAIISVMSVLNGMIFYTSTGTGICYIVQIVTGVMCIRCNIKVFGILSQDQNKASDMLIKFYREIQILTGKFNSIHRALLLHIMEAITLAQILLIYICICSGISSGSGPSIPLFALLVCGILSLQTVAVVLVTYGLGSEPHSCSAKVLQDLKKINGIASRIVGRRFIASCPMLKVQIGSMNFIEKNTSLKIEAFCTGRIVDLLLLQ
ncbi:unnamed protein product [Orchesella dallaii]|uniref:Odorant receptor n=1 Tax=Orchesella dallaii TaxID=48710 RepID=A0ABP1S520_9HEXA